MSFILSIDIGTTNIKASLVNKNGTLMGVSRKSQTIHRGKSGKNASHRPETLIKSIIECSKEAVKGRESETKLIVVSVYQYGLVLLDDNFQPISNISTLLDTRSKETYAEFLKDTDASSLYSKTGCPSFTQSILPRLYYFKRCLPERLKAANYYLSAKAWVLYCLTGKLITEASTESVSQFLNIHTLEWEQDILDLIGIKTDQLPEIVEPMEKSYPVRSDILKEIGLPSDCQILPGVYDGGAICLGMDSYRQGQAVSNIGTSGMLRVLSNQLVLDDPDKMRYQPFYLMDGNYLIGGATNNAALPLKWMKENLLELSYDEIDRLAHNSPIGSSGLFFMPYLTGERDIKIGSTCSASFFGLKEHHQKSDFIRAILEGVAYNLNMLKQSLAEGGINIHAVNIGGGGVRKADIWVNILANVLNLSLTRSNHEEPCLIGNAIMGFTHLGIFPDIESASKKLTSLGETISPSEELIICYQENYKFFKEIYYTFENLYAKHSRFSKDIRKVCSYIS